MGKGDEDLRIIVDTNGTATVRTVELHFYDDMDATEYAFLKVKAALWQTDFDTAAGNIWAWYDGWTATQKSRLRTSFLSV